MLRWTLLELHIAADMTENPQRMLDIYPTNKVVCDIMCCTYFRNPLWGKVVANVGEVRNG